MPWGETSFNRAGIKGLYPVIICQLEHDYTMSSKVAAFPLKMSNNTDPSHPPESKNHTLFFYQDDFYYLTKKLTHFLTRAVIFINSQRFSLFHNVSWSVLRYLKENLTTKLYSSTRSDAVILHIQHST